jgi:hypothetical protein
LAGLAAVHKSSDPAAGETFPGERYLLARIKRHGHGIGANVRYKLNFLLGMFAAVPPSPGHFVDGQGKR